MNPFLIYYIMGIAGLSLAVGVFLIIRNFKNNDDDTAVPISNIDEISGLAKSESFAPSSPAKKSNFAQHIVSENLKTPTPEPKPDLNFSEPTQNPADNFQLQELKQDIERLTAQNKDLQDALEREMKSKDVQPVAQTTSLPEDLEKIQTLENEVQTLKNQNSELAEAKETLLRAKETLNLEKENLSNNIKSLQTDNETLNNKNASLEGKVVASDSSNLEDKIIDLEKRLFETESKNTNLSKQIQELETENTALKDSSETNESATHKINALETEIERLRSQHEEGLSSFRAQNKQLIDEINTLKQELGESEKNKGDAEKRIFTLQQNEGKLKQTYEEDVEKLRANLNFLHEQHKIEIEKRNTEIQKLQSSLSNEYGNNVEKLDQLEKKIKALEEYQAKSAERESKLRYELTKTKAQNVALNGLLSSQTQKI